MYNICVNLRLACTDLQSAHRCKIVLKLILVITQLQVQYTYRETLLSP